MWLWGDGAGCGWQLYVGIEEGWLFIGPLKAASLGHSQWHSSAGLESHYPCKAFSAVALPFTSQTPMQTSGMYGLLPESVIRKFSTTYLLAFQNPQEGDDWEWGSFLCSCAQWHVDRQAFMINTLNSYLEMVLIQKSWNCLMGPTTGVIGGHMYSIDLFSWGTGALFRCGCENT